MSGGAAIQVLALGLLGAKIDDNEISDTYEASRLRVAIELRSNDPTGGKNVVMSSNRVFLSGTDTSRFAQKYAISDQHTIPVIQDGKPWSERRVVRTRKPASNGSARIELMPTDGQTASRCLRSLISGFLRGTSAPLRLARARYAVGLGHHNSGDRTSYRWHIVTSAAFGSSALFRPKAKFRMFTTGIGIGTGPRPLMRLARKLFCP